MGPSRSAQSAERSHGDVPEVDEGIGHLDEGETLVDGQPPRTERVGCETCRDRAILAHRSPHELEGLEPQPRPVLERPAISVVPAIQRRGQELSEEEGVRPVDVHDVKTRIARPLCRHHPVTLHSPYVAFVHLLCSRACGVVGVGDGRRANGRPSRLPRVRVRAPVVELDAGERTMGMDPLAHERQVGSIVVVPDAGGDERHGVGVGAHRARTRCTLQPTPLRPSWI